MIENNEKISILSCPECGNILPNRIVNEIAQNKARVYCEYCGVLISHEIDAKRSTSSEQQENKFSLSTSDINDIFKKYIYRRIYVLLKSNLVSYKKIEHKLPLKKSNIRLLVSKLKKDLLKLKIPGIDIKKFSLTSQELLDGYLNDLKTSLKSAKTIRKKDHNLMGEAIEFVFNLVQGRFDFQTLPKKERDVIIDLKQCFGFKVKLIPNDSFEYFLSQKLCVLIYRYLTRLYPIFSKDNEQSNLTSLKIDDITHQIVDFTTTAQIKDILPKNLSTVHKQSMSRKLGQLQKELKFDWTYCQAFQDHIYFLIGIIHGLISRKDVWDSLVEQNLQISKSLIESAVFEKDPDFSTQFKLNLTIVLSRIIFTMLDCALINIKPDLRPKDITAPMEEEIVNKLSNEFAEQKKINIQFLNKFYNLSLEEFTTNYNILLNKFTTDLIFVNSFREFLKQLTKIVYKITQMSSKKSKLLKIEQAIISDLANFTINQQETEFFYREFNDDKLIYGFLNSKKNPQEFQSWLLKRDTNQIKGELKNKIRNTKDFIEYLRIEMEKNVPLNYLDSYGRLSLINMSLLLDGREDYISSIILRKANHDLTYRLALDVIMKWKSKLKKLGANYRSSIGLLMAYLEFHKPVIPISHHISWSQYRSQKFIKEDFFNKIDTIEKAYWLGFFFGDASITYKHNKLRRIIITLKAESLNLLYQLCGSLGLHPSSIYGPYEHKHKDGHVYMEVQLSISSNIMVNDIIKAGFTPPMRGKQAKKIKWPSHLLITEELKLAFILGFYDAEGRTGTTQIRQGDRDFLDTIVYEFNLPFEPKYDEYGWNLTLGGDLLNRAQKIVLENTRIRGIIEKRKKYQHHGPTDGFIKNITKESLKELVDQMPIPKIASKYGVNNSVVYQTMRRWKIESKPRGFWRNKEGNHAKIVNLKEE